MTKTCEWTEYKDGTWRTECNQAIPIMIYTAFGSITEGLQKDGFQYCPYCGGKLHITEYKEPQE
jgi:hypothetical protein